MIDFNRRSLAHSLVKTMFRMHRLLAILHCAFCTVHFALCILHPMTFSCLFTCFTSEHDSKRPSARLLLFFFAWLSLTLFAHSQYGVHTRNHRHLNTVHYIEQRQNRKRAGFTDIGGDISIILYDWNKSNVQLQW